MLQGKGPVLFFGMWISSFSSTICWKDSPVSTEWSDILVDNHLIIYAKVYFWSLYSVPLVCMSLFMRVPHCFTNWGFIINFEVSKCKSSDSSSFSRLFWLFEIPWDDIRVLGCVFLFISLFYIGPNDIKLNWMGSCYYNMAAGSCHRKF